jgi:hypothetical protein
MQAVVWRVGDWDDATFESKPIAGFMSWYAAERQFSLSWGELKYAVFRFEGRKSTSLGDQGFKADVMHCESGIFLLKTHAYVT